MNESKLFFAALLASAQLIFAAATPGNPILVLAIQDKFGLYTGEILKAEGFNEFQIESPSDAGITLSYLQNFDVVILAETALTDAQRTVLTSFVNAGGRLIAFRPDKQLCSLFGVADAGSTLSEGYLKINTATSTGAGLVSETMRFHGTADRYALDGATAIATLCSNVSTATSNPAVVMNKYGRGRSVAFAYNLPDCIVGFHQGNWALTGATGNGDGVSGRRHQDRFINGWVDITKNHINRPTNRCGCFPRAS